MKISSLWINQIIIVSLKFEHFINSTQLPSTTESHFLRPVLVLVFIIQIHVYSFPIHLLLFSNKTKQPPSCFA